MQIDWNKVKEHLYRFRYPYLLLGIVILANVHIFAELVADWYRDDNYSHGFLIIPVAIYLFWGRRHQLIFPAPPSGVGLVLLAMGCIGLIVGVAASEFFVTRLSLVIIITGLAMYSLGMENFRKVWFSFFFLLFMIPIPAIIYFSATFPMQLFASQATNVFLQFIGMPTVLHGNIIELPDYRLEVAEACSGLRSLVTLLALSSLYAFLSMPGKWMPLVLVLATFPVAIATNVIRIIVTAIGAYAVSSSFADSFLHEVSGMLVFVTAMIMIGLIGAILKWIARRSS